MAVINGTGGNDTLYGLAEADSITGFEGNDLLYGEGGNDLIIFNAGDDTVYGGLGDDTIDDAAGSPFLVGNNLVYGGDGNDLLWDSAGNDTYYGGAGNDTLSGDSAGNDQFFGEAGRDELFGGAGADSLFGGADADTIDGGIGNDLIDGGAGNDSLRGGDGDDRFVLLDGFGVDTIVAGEAGQTSGDVLDASGMTTAGTLTIGASGENGTLVSGSNRATFSELERFFLGGGNDSVTAAAATVGVFVDAGGGNDTLRGGSGSDTFYGGVGADSISGGDGTDLIYGGDGNDTINGDRGVDRLYGGAGDDVFVLGFEFGNDSIFGGESGETLGDTLDFGTVTVGMNVQMSADKAGTAQAVISTATFAEIERFSLTANNDTFAGAGSDDVVYGGGGADSLAGHAGNDLLDGGIGADTLIGGTGNDTLLGGAGNDVLYGDDNTAQRITNGDFSAGTAGWTINNPTGGAAPTVYDAGSPVSPGLAFNNNDEGVYGDSIQQTISTNVGEVYDLALTLYENGSGSASHTVVVAVLNASGAVVTSQTYVVGNGATLNPTFSFTANSAASIIRITNTTSTGSNNTDVVVDNVSVIGRTPAVGDDLLQGGDGADTIYGGDGRDTLDGGAGNDVLVGGAGADVFVVSGADTISDFDATSGISGNGNQDNDFVDLSAYYNKANLAAWNAANPTNQFDNPLKWLQADQADGVLQSAGGLRILNGGAPVSGAAFNVENTAVCFAAGTRLNTAKGHRPIEKLRVGDLVETADHGLQPVRWIGQMCVCAADEMAPIFIAAGALGNRRDLLVSPQHRMLLSGWQVELMFGESEVFAAAKMLVNGTTIRPQPMAQVTYYHLMFDAHEIVFAEGAGAESFHPGEEGFDALGQAACDEICALFPQIAAQGFAAYGPSARRSLRAHEARLLNMGRKLQDTGQMQSAPRKRAVAAK